MSGDPYQLYDVQENLEKKCHRAPITEEVKEFGEIGTHSLRDSKYQRRPTSNRTCTSTIPQKALQILILEDGELQKMLTSPLYAQKASGKPDAMIVQEREVSAQFAQADRKESLRSHSSEGQKALGKPNALFSSEKGNLIRSSVFRNADPSNSERISS